MDNEITNNTLYEVQVKVLNTELGDKNLTTLGEEIDAYDNLAGRCFEEVCKRYWYIKNVVFKDDRKGWREWRDKQNRKKAYINRCIQIYQVYLDSKSGYSNSHFELGYMKNSLLCSLVEESDREAVVNNTHEINGVEKTVDSMTVKELEAVIKQQKEKIKEQETTIKDSEKKSQEEKNNAKDEGFKEGFKEGKQAKIDDTEEAIKRRYEARYNEAIETQKSNIKKSYQDELDDKERKLKSKDREIEIKDKELAKYKQLNLCEKDVDDRLRRQTEIIEELNKEEEVLESWGEVMAELDLVLAKLNVVSMSEYSLNNKTENAVKKSALYCSNRLKEIYTYLDETFDPSTVDSNYVDSEFEYIEEE